MSDGPEPAGPRRDRRAPWYVQVAAYVVAGLGTTGLTLAMSHAAENFYEGAVGGLLFGASVLTALVWAAMSRKGRPYLAVVGVCTLVLIGAHVTRAPLHVRFQLSESAFEHWVAGRPPVRGDSQTFTSLHLGLFDIDYVEESADGYLFYDAAGNLSDTGDGIAYLPFGHATAFNGYEEDEFTHLDGPWYAWVGYS